MSDLFRQHAVAIAIAIGAASGLLTVVGMNTVYEQHLREASVPLSSSSSASTSTQGTHTSTDYRGRIISK